MLTESLAQQIAWHTSEVAGLNVVITDHDGVIIGSGDPDRVGSFHEASIEVIRTGKPRSHTAEQAHELVGVRPGITLPIVLDGEVAGTVGLTGSPAKVRRFGLLVQSHTEILLRESQLITSRMVREKAVADLIREVAHYDAEVVPPGVVEHAAGELGYELSLPRVAVAIDVLGVPATRSASVVRTLREVFADPQDVVGSLGPTRFAVLHRVGKDAERVVQACREAADGIRAAHRADVRAGLGGTAASVGELRDSYRDALDALRLGQRDAEPVRRIDDFRIHQLLDGVGHRERARFRLAVLGRLGEQPDWEVLRDTVRAWCQSGFHLVNASRALRVHRNTLIYRLRKIERLAGIDEGDHRAMLALYVGCVLDGS